MQETRIWSLGWEDPLEKGMATHTNISCLENSMDRGAWQATVHGVTELDTTEWLSMCMQVINISELSFFIYKNGDNKPNLLTSADHQF